jgi:antitoxin PrlF
MGESGTKIAERLVTRPEGATMSEIVGATGGPQYNLLKRLEGRGYRIRKTKEGAETRYFAEPPSERSYELTVTSQGQMTIPKEVREWLGVGAGGKIRLTVDADGRMAISPVELSVRRMFGMLGKPPRSLTLEEIDEAIADAAVERFGRKVK